MEKFLLSASVRLAKHDNDYSWEYRAKLDEEIQKLLDGILAGKSAHDGSVGLLARCSDVFPNSYSRKFLKAELERRFDAKRLAPRPDFQLTLDYAARLTGEEFEGWLERLLRESGISSVQRTQQTRDQGADLIVEIGKRRIVIQAKQYSESVGNDAVQQAYAASGFYHASEAWVVTTSTFTKDALDLAFRLGVILIPGSQLSNLPTRLLASCVASAAELPPTAVREEPFERSTEAQTKGGSRLDFQAPAQIEDPTADHLRLTTEDQNFATLPAIALQTKSTVAIRRSRSAALLACCIVAATTIYAGRQQTIKADNRRGIQALVDKYQTAIRAKNLAAVGECYAPVVERYYLAHNVARERVQRDLGRAFARYDSIAKLSLTNLTFRDLSGSRATATLDRDWDFRGTKDFAGHEQEELVFVKEDGQWRITSEKELRVYWVRHPR